MFIKKSLLSCLVFACMLSGATLPAFALYADDNLQRMNWVDRARKISLSNLAGVEERAVSGDIQAQMTLAYALTGDSPVPENPEKALNYALMAVKKGNPFAQAMLMYIANRYPAVNISKDYAFKMALESSNQGNSIGTVNAGTAYMFGVGVEQNLESAYLLFEEAHKAGHPEAMLRLCFLQALSEEKKNGSLLLKLFEHQVLFNYTCGPNLGSDADSTAEADTKEEAVSAIHKGDAPPVTGNAQHVDEKHVGIAGPPAKVEQEKELKVASEARLAADQREQGNSAALKQEENRKVAAERVEQDRLAATKIPVDLKNNHNEQITKSDLRKYFKYVDRNGLVFWLDDQSKTPPPVPVYHKYEDKNGLVFWVDDVNKIPEEYRTTNTRNGEVAGNTVIVAGKAPDQKVQQSAKNVKNKSRRLPAKLGAIKPMNRSKE